MEDSTPGQPFRIAGTKGERLPVLEPEHLARGRRRVPAPTLGTVSPTALAHCYSRARLAKVSGRAPALVSLPKGTLVEQGRHPPGPCSGDLVSAKWFPAHLAEGSRGGMGPSTSVLAQGHAGGAGGATHRTLAQGVRCQPNAISRHMLNMSLDVMLPSANE